MHIFLFADGYGISGVHEGVKPWTGIISPQEMTEESAETAFTGAFLTMIMIWGRGNVTVYQMANSDMDRREGHSAGTGRDNPGPHG